MGLFNFFNRKNERSDHLNGTDILAQQLAENPQNGPVEKDKQLYPGSAEKNSSSSEQGINLLFQFLEKNFEKKNLRDANRHKNNPKLK